MQAEGAVFFVILSDGRVLQLAPRPAPHRDDDGEVLVIEREFSLLQGPAQDVVVRSAVFHASRNVFVWLQVNRPAAGSPTTPTAASPATAQKIVTRRLVWLANNKWVDGVDVTI